MPNKPPFWKFFSEIEIPQSLKGKTTFHSGNTTNKDKMSGLEKINIFVGPNNSGKSFVLREILKSDPKAILSGSTLEEFRKTIDEFKVDLKRLDSGTSRTMLKKLDTLPTLYSPDSISQIVKLIDETLLSLANHLGTLKSAVHDLNLLSEVFNSVKMRLQVLIDETPQPNQISNGIYIPVMRTIKNYLPDYQYYIRREVLILDNAAVSDGLKRTRIGTEFRFLEERIESEYKLHSSNKKCTIFNGQEMFDLLKQQNNSHTDDSISRKKDYENFLKKNFFNGSEVVLGVDLSDDKPTSTFRNQVYFKIGREASKPIYELGDGIQQMIILTFPLFFYDSGIFVIEEPEMNIHPGLQKQLMSIYNKCGYDDQDGNDYSDNFMFFIATHSNHILDTTLENENTSIYRVEKTLEPSTNIPDFNIFYQKHNNAILDCLGVNASSVFLANGIIWVEGPSDAIYIEHWLNLFIKKYNKSILTKGLHYSFQYLNLFTLNTVGYNNFWEYAAQNPENIISLADLNHNSLFVTDNDGAFNLSADNFSVSKIPSVDQRNTKQNTKYNFIEKILAKKDLKADQITNVGGEYENKLIYWINQFTVESYLNHFLNKHGEEEQKFETWPREAPRKFNECFKQSNDFYSVEKDKVSKVELARIITSKFTSFDDYFVENEELHKKINALYNTIAAWNKTNL